ncbi:MAG: hypothetical protein ACRD1H_07255, partial [Vicinamibacterales bacterium]
ESTGPAEVVIVGWRLASDAALPVQVSGRVAGDVRVTNDELRVSGRVVTEQAPRTSTRDVLSGWEEHGSPTAVGTFSAWNRPQGRALPVAQVSPK